MRKQDERPSMNKVRLGLIGFGLCLGLVSAELLARVFPTSASAALRLGAFIESERGKFCRYDAGLGWDGLPNADADFEWVDCRCHVRQNACGYRDHAVPLARGAARRILVLGDSFVWGFGVNEPQLLTAVMRQGAREPLEVVNLGVSGYGTDQELLLWRQKGRQWRPDVVLVFFSIDNDLLDISNTNRYGYSKPAFVLNPAGQLQLLNTPVPQPAAPWNPAADAFHPSGHEPLRQLVRHSALARCCIAASLRWTRWRTFLEKNWIVPPQAAVGGSDNLIPFQVPYDAEVTNAWQLLSGMLRTLHEEAHSQGARLVLVSVPTRAQVYARWRTEIMQGMPLPQGKRWDWEEPNRQLAGLARKSGIPFLDLLPGLQHAAQKDAYLYFPYNLHWTAAGHAVVAALVADFLSTSNPPPP